jgi:hypothetical protein
MNAIKSAKNTIELNEIVEKSSQERDFELDNSLTYGEQADFFEKEADKAGNGKTELLELVKILRDAESKWFELENNH